MRKKILKCLVALVFLSSTLVAGEVKGTIIIHSPKNNEKVDSKKELMINFETTGGGSPGNNLHLMVDGKKKGLLRQLKGSTDVGPLKPGKHEICLSFNETLHMPEGQETCITVISE